MAVNDRYFEALGPDQAGWSSYAQYGPAKPYCAVVAVNRREARTQALRHFREQGSDFFGENPFSHIELFEVERCPHGEPPFSVDEKGQPDGYLHDWCGLCEVFDMAADEHERAMRYGWRQLAVAA